MNIKDILNKSEFVRHIHQITLSTGGMNIECVYENGNCQVATLIKGNGKFEILGQSDRDIIAEHIANELGEARILRYS